MTRFVGQRLERALRDPVRGPAWALSLGAAGVFATQVTDLLSNQWPDLFASDWVWVPSTVVIFLASSFLFYPVFRFAMVMFVGVYIDKFKPQLLTRFISAWISGLEGERDSQSAKLSGLETAARERARKRFEHVIEPAIPGTIHAFQNLRRQLRSEPRSPIVELVRTMSERCISEVPLRAHPAVNIIYADPIHRTIEFPPKFTWLLTQPSLQRLNEIRQLPFAFPKYPGATHTRFSHSLGVAHLARSVVRRVIERGIVYTTTGKKQLALDAAERERLVSLATVCGLVHDMGHAPLGHTLDRFFRTQFFEGEATSDADKEFLPRILNSLAEPIKAIDGIGLEEVREILAGEESLTGWLVFLSQLVNSQLDVDRIDYLQRDAHFTGQLEGLLNVESLLSSIRPFESGDRIFLTFDESYLGDIEQFVYARDVMYLRCYEHPHKVVSEALSSRAVHRLFKLVPELRDNLDSFATLTDMQLVEIVNSLKDDEEGGPRDLFRRVSRCEALAYSEVDSVPFDTNAVDGWLKVLLGDFTYASETLMDKVAETEKRIAAEAGVDAQDVVLVLPDPKANEERTIALDIYVLVKENAGYRSIPLLSEEEETSPSEVLQRRKFVPKEVVDAAEDLDEVRRAAATGISLLGIIRRARFKLRLFLKNTGEDSRTAVKKAFRGLGVRFQ